MALHRLRVVHEVPLSMVEAWAFFSDPRNLGVLTPLDVDFVIHGDVPAEMYAGMLIEYTVRPLFGVPVRWVTEITQVDEGRYFVDEQRAGPYRLWHHEHHFHEVPGGVEVTDLVSYLLPFGPLGDLLNRLIVQRRLEHIFDYRRAVLVDRFGVAIGEGG